MTIRKNKAYTTAFPIIDTTNRPGRKTGVSFGAGDTKISLDGGAPSNTTNNPTEIGTSGRYALTLTAAEMNADFIAVWVEKSGIDPFDIPIATGGQPSGSVVADGGNTTTTFKTDLTEATNDYWKDCLILFTSGALIGQVKKVGAYDGTTKFITLATGYDFTTAPSGGDRFVLVDL